MGMALRAGVRRIGTDFSRDWAVLRFEGLDTFATILLNGEEIGRTANMFIAHEFEVGSRLRVGVNHLEVRFVPVLRRAWRTSRTKSLRSTTAFNFTGERVYARKMQCGFGWDWVHRLVTAGIWQSVTLRSYRDARVEDVYVRTTVTADEPEGGVAAWRSTAAVRTGGPCGRGWRSSTTAAAWWPGNRRRSAKVPIMPAADEVARPEIVVAGGLRRTTALRMPCRAASTPSGETLDERAVTEIGLRTVAIEQIPDDVGSSFHAAGQRHARLLSGRQLGAG